jgi:hypothetical protein
MLHYNWVAQGHDLKKKNAAPDFSGAASFVIGIGIRDPAPP